MGKTRQSASPATGLTSFLTATASAESATSNAKGPSTTQPEICPLSAIFEMIAASTQAGIPGNICSVAVIIATLGLLLPSA